MAVRPRRRARLTSRKGLLLPAKCVNFTRTRDLPRGRSGPQGDGHGTAAQGEVLTTAQFEALEASEATVVRLWRFEELIRAGYDDEDAIELAFHLDVDLHHAASLVRRGCPSGTAARIML